MSTLRIAAVAAVLVVKTVAAAGEPRTYRCEAKGGPAWREYRSAHFVVATGAPRFKAEKLIADLERLHALVVQALVGEQVEIPGRARVVAFSDAREFARHTGRDDIGGFFGETLLEEPLITLSFDGFDADPELIAEEIAHHVSFHLYPRQPHWFAEGLAMFVRTVAREREQAVAKTGTHIVRGGREASGRWAGLVPASFVRYLQDFGDGMPKDLLTWDDRAGEAFQARYHLWSWLLYHYLWNKRSAELTRFAERLSDSGDPDASWREIFPDLDPAKPGGLATLVAELERYRKAGRFLSYEVKATGEPGFTDGPLAPAEVHALLASVRADVDADARRAPMRAETEEALQHDGSHPVAIALRAELAETSPLEALRASAAARPQDWRSAYLLGAVIDDPKDAAEKEAALRRATTLAPDAAVAQNALAWLLANTGRAREALPLANRALDLAPWHAPFVDTLAVVAAELGKCSEALTLERRALGLIPTGDERRGSYEKRLAEIEGRCASKAGVKPAP